MAAPNYWTNNDGLNVRFGTRDSKDGSKRPAEVPNMEFSRTLELAFSYDDLPGPREYDVGIMRVPAGAYVKNAFLVVDSEFTGGTHYTIGLQEADGTEIDNDGLFESSELEQSDLSAGAVIEASAGDFIGDTIGDKDGYIVVTPEGDFTSGEARLIVEFLPEYDSRLND